MHLGRDLKKCVYHVPPLPVWHTTKNADSLLHRKYINILSAAFEISVSNCETSWLRIIFISLQTPTMKFNKATFKTVLPRSILWVKVFTRRKFGANMAFSARSSPTTEEGYSILRRRPCLWKIIGTFGPWGLSKQYFKKNYSTQHFRNYYFRGLFRN